MIVDTSALIAILYEEPGSDAMRRALLTEVAFIPAPVVLEFLRVASLESHRLGDLARQLLASLQSFGAEIVPFDAHHALIAQRANHDHGKGMGKGGKLNLLDLMVYAVAQQRGEPLLCTGNDFAATDLVLHKASRAG